MPTCRSCRPVPTGHPLVLIRKHDDALRGRMVLRTGFVPVRGPLHIEDLWGRGVVGADPAELVHEPDPAPRFTARRPEEPMRLTDDETDLLFFLGLQDRRACWAPEGPALSGGADGWAALAPDGIWWWKDASLARELCRRFRDWDAHGRARARGLPGVLRCRSDQERHPAPGAGR